MDEEKISDISLAAARVNAGFTQDQVAKKMHVSNKTVVNWENGKVEPSFASLCTLAMIYGVPVNCIRLPKKYA